MTPHLDWLSKISASEKSQIAEYILDELLAVAQTSAVLRSPLPECYSVDGHGTMGSCNKSLQPPYWSCASVASAASSRLHDHERALAALDKRLGELRK